MLNHLWRFIIWRGHSETEQCCPSWEEYRIKSFLHIFLSFIDFALIFGFQRRVIVAWKAKYGGRLIKHCIDASAVQPRVLVCR